MAVFTIKDTLNVIRSHIAASGYARENQIGEFKSAPSGQIAAAVWWGGMVVYEAPLQQLHELHNVFIRFYMNMLQEPQEDIDIRLNEAVAKIEEDLVGDFTLGGTVRNIDIAGQVGDGLTVTTGFETIDGVVYRMADMVFGVQVDNDITQAP